MNSEAHSTSSVQAHSTSSVQAKNCQNCHNEFQIDAQDFDFYKKIDVPPPTFCPECRMIRRFSYRNDRNLFRVKDAHTGKEIFSGIPPQSGLTVYALDYWKSDGWDAMEYGREYDFSRPFFEQFREIMRVVPWPSKSVQGMVNSDYCNQAGYFKNAYLCFNGDAMEDSAYTIQSSYTKNSFDLFETMWGELCYDSLLVGKSYKTLFSMDCDNCADVWFSKGLSGCNNCFGCVNLRGKSYHIFNKPYSKDEYLNKLKELRLDSYLSIEKMRAECHEFWKKFPVKYIRGYRNFMSSGDNLWDTKNVSGCFSVHGAENMRYCQMLIKNSDSYDYSVWGSSSNMYECQTCGEQCYGLKFCFDCWPSSKNIEYSISCRSSSDLFGCFGLKKKQYCILNKQYTKEEYEAIIPKIKEHMNKMPYISQMAKSPSAANASEGKKEQIVYKYGEFFPPEFSPFAYNETINNDFFPLNKENATERGYIWRDTEPREYQKTINGQDLPDLIVDVADSVLKEIIACISCGRAYRIISNELQFYRQMKLPLPRKCVNCRFADRFMFINPPRFFQRSCECGGATSEKANYTNRAKHFHGDNKCLNEFETSYSPDRPEIIYCEQCYNEEVS